MKNGKTVLESATIHEPAHRFRKAQQIPVSTLSHTLLYPTQEPFPEGLPARFRFLNFLFASLSLYFATYD